MPSPLSTTGKIAKPDLDAYLKELAKGPKDVAQTELKNLLDAGEARLPDGAASVLRDAQWALQNDAWDPTKQTKTARPAPPAVQLLELQREKAMDGAAAVNHLLLACGGKAEPNAQIEIVNLSKQNAPVVWKGTAGQDGVWAAPEKAQAKNAFYGETFGVRVTNPSTGARSDVVALVPKPVEIQVWQSGKRDKVDLTGQLRTEAPFVQANLVEQHQQMASVNEPEHHLVLAGKAGSVPANAKLEVLINNKPQTVNAMPDGSFLFDVKGIEPGKNVELRVIDHGQVTAQNFATKPLHFDLQKLLTAHQGVPYDKIAGKQPDENGPFLRFQLDNVADPGSTIVVTNFTKGTKHEFFVDQNGRANFELPGVHAGDALGFVCRDPAGFLAEQQAEGWAVPAVGVDDTRLKQILCGNTMLTAQVDEALAILQAKPTSVHRETIEHFLENDAKRIISNGADLTRFKKEFNALYGEDNNVRSNPENPEPKDPIVIGARIIKPRQMDAQQTTQEDPLEVEGKAEPFAMIEIRNASRQGAPVIGAPVQADKDGNFKFIGTNERQFAHGDQLYVKATDVGGKESGSVVAKTCAYELQIWTQQPRQQLVELPHSTDTNDPFIDAAKLEHKLDPISPRAKDQTYTFNGGPRSVEPNAILRVQTQKGKVSEATSGKDGSFKLPVGAVTPGETLTLQVIDTNGRTTSTTAAVPPLKFDHAALLRSGAGAPFLRYGDDGNTDGKGPYLEFRANAVVDPHSIVVVKNNTTGRSMEVPSDENGNVAFTLNDVHSGDSLTFSARDPASNVAEPMRENYVVPAESTFSEALQGLAAQHEYLAADVDKLIELLGTHATANDRVAFEEILGKTDAFEDEALQKKLAKAVADAFAPPNDVRMHTENPAPKRPIVLDADIIRTVTMDQNNNRTGNARGQLEVRGKAEPFANVEVKNASAQGFPTLQTVQADKNGDWKIAVNENKAMPGDQLLIKTKDQLGAESKERLVTTGVYELQQFPGGRTERVKLDVVDGRDPFLDTAKIAATRVPAQKDTKEQAFIVKGAPITSEPNCVVRVTNSKGQAYEGRVMRDGSFDVNVKSHTPGETLNLQVIDGRGKITQHNIETPNLKFNPTTFVGTSEGAPYVKIKKGDVGRAPAPEQQQGEPQELRDGPFLRFAQDAAVDPFSFVVIKNNSTGKEFRTQADANGRIDIEIDGVHTGDSLKIYAEDGAGNRAPDAQANYVVPAEPRATSRLNDITCMHTLMKEHVDELLDLLEKNPTAANRGLLEGWLAEGESKFQPATERARVEAAVERVYRVNNVRTDTTNPAPKEPIILDSNIIKPRVMDQPTPSRPRDPLVITGKAEPFAWIEVRNASVKNTPVLGQRVQADENGDFKFEHTREQDFRHGDQMLIRAVDQGDASSKAVLSRTCAYELRVWQQTGRQELVKLPDNTDTREPFIDMTKVKVEQTIANKKASETFTAFAGGPGSSEPGAVVRVSDPHGKVLSEAKVKDDGSFELNAGGYVPGDSLTVQVFNAGGQIVQENVATAALKFDPAKLLANVDGPPYQKVVKDKPAEGGPFLRLNAADAMFPNAMLVVTNHATGRVQKFQADENGGIDVELAGVHAFDLLTFEVQDLAGNKAPNSERAWQVPVESRGNVDTELLALTQQRPIDEEIVDLMLERLGKQPTPQHRALVDGLLHQHPDWFTDGKKKLEDGIAEIFKGPPELVPDVSNPAPKRPIVLGTEIVTTRMMDNGGQVQGNAPLVVTGKAEPLSVVEIHNGSMPNRPKIGEVKVGEDGTFRFDGAKNNQFAPGDQLVLESRDAGGAKSTPTVSRAKSIDVRIWNSTNRTEKVAVPGDGRDPWLQTDKLTTARGPGATQSDDSFVISGPVGSTEIYGTVSVKIGENTYKTEATIDGSFELPVKGLTLGEAIEITVGSAPDRQAKLSYTPTV